MLVLSRKVGQRILIGDDVVVTVVEMGNGKVKLGVSAPREIPVFREELTTGETARRCRYCATGEGSSCTCV